MNLELTTVGYWTWQTLEVSCTSHCHERKEDANGEEDRIRRAFTDTETHLVRSCGVSLALMKLQQAIPVLLRLLLCFSRPPNLRPLVCKGRLTRLEMIDGCADVMGVTHLLVFSSQIVIYGRREDGLEDR